MKQKAESVKQEVRKLVSFGDFYISYAKYHHDPVYDYPFLIKIAIKPSISSLFL